MTQTIEQMLARWETDEGKPYKGKLVDERAYAQDPTNIGCMCAQGQALHLIGGMPVDEIALLEQREADTRVMEIFSIPRGQAILLRNINDSQDGAPAIVITHPDKVLGDQAQAVLTFFRYIDSLDNAGWQKVAAARAAARDAAWAAARAAARDAAWAAAGDAAGDAAFAGAWAAAFAGAWAAARDAAFAGAWAANEIQGASILEKDGKPLFFLSIFGFKTVAELMEWAS